MNTAPSADKAWLPELARRLKQLIAKKGFASEQQFCREAGLSLEAVRSVRRGHAPEVSTVLAFAKTLGVSVEHLLTDAPDSIDQNATEDRIIKAVHAVYEAQQLGGFRATADEFAVMLLHYLALQRIPQGDEAAREALAALKSGS